MDALEPSFMLLPAFTFHPDGEIQLGRVLPTAKGSKLPDARRPLNVRIDVERERVSPFDHGPWHWESDDSFNVSGGVWSDLSILTGIGAGVDGSRGRKDTLDISSTSVIEETFVPTPNDISRVLADDAVSSILKKIDRPPVYLITGRMIANGADISIKRGREHGGGAHASADLTSTGAPVNVGAKGDVKQSRERTLVQSPRTPFILAYQLLRLKKKYFGAVEEKFETKHALFSDMILIDGEEPSAGEINVEELIAAEMNTEELTAAEMDIDVLLPEELDGPATDGEPF